MKRYLLTGTILAAIWTPNAHAVTLDFGGLTIGGNALCASSPGCILALSATPDSVTKGALSIGVQAYGVGLKPTFLTQRPNSANPADESGLGVSLTSPTPSDSDLEINKGEYVLLDNHNAEAHHFKPTDISVGSLQDGESATIWGYSGLDGTLNLLDLHTLVGGTLTGTPSLQDFNLSQGGLNPIYGAYVITGGGISGGDTLVASEGFSAVPELPTWAMALMGFATFGVMAAFGAHKRPSRYLI